MASVRQSCTRLGVGALVSTFASLLVLLFLIETRQVLTWFVASTLLAVLAFAVAAIASIVEEKNNS